MTMPPLEYRPTFREYGLGPPPGVRTDAGHRVGIAAVILCWTGPLAMALGFVSISQARRGGGSTVLGLAGMVIGSMTSLVIIVWVLWEVWATWSSLG